MDSRRANLGGRAPATKARVRSARDAGRLCARDRSPAISLRRALGVVTVRVTARVGRGLKGAFSSESAKARSARRRPQTGRASCDLRGSLLDRRAGEPRNDRRFCRRQLRLRNGTPLSIRLAPIARYLASSIQTAPPARTRAWPVVGWARLQLRPPRCHCIFLSGLFALRCQWARAWAPLSHGGPMRTAQLRQHLLGRPPLPGGHPAHGAPPLTRRTEE
jgi:hypothetical protein